VMAAADTSAKEIAQTNMEWTEQHDNIFVRTHHLTCVTHESKSPTNILCQEILVLEPFKAKKGSIARGQIWDKIANNLNSLQHPQFRVTTRSVRERYTLLSDKFRAKMRDEEKARGIDTDLSDVEKALEEIEKEAVVEETAQNSKRKGNEIQNIGGTQKRQRKDEVENKTAARAKRRISGDTVAYLREKNELMQKWKMEEMQLQKRRLKAESKAEEQSKKEHRI
ncbi:hypothetical protein pdam_00024413, partial [Pocillopora damicornis]